MAMKSSLAIALSSTRSLSRISISGPSAPFAASWSRRICGAVFDRGGRLALEAVNVFEPKPEVDDLDACSNR